LIFNLGSHAYARASNRKSDAGPWNDGYADNLSIILHGLDGR